METVLFDDKERNNIGKIPSVIYLSYDLNFDNRKCLVCSLAIGWETFYDMRSKKRNISKLWSSLTLSNLVRQATLLAKNGTQLKFINNAMHLSCK